MIIWTIMNIMKSTPARMYVGPQRGVCMLMELMELYQGFVVGGIEKCSTNEPKQNLEASGLRSWNSDLWKAALTSLIEMEGFHQS